MLRLCSLHACLWSFLAERRKLVASPLLGGVYTERSLTRAGAGFFPTLATASVPAPSYPTS